MTNEAENLMGEEHVRRYRETDGAVGHVWRNGSKIALLTTKGRRSGLERTHPLIYGEDGSGTIAMVASKGGADQHPAWYLNLEADPDVTIQILDEVYEARARTATDDERAHWWPIMTKAWPDYDEYQTKTERTIPIVLFDRVTSSTDSAVSAEMEPLDESPIASI